MSGADPDRVDELVPADQGHKMLSLAAEWIPTLTERSVEIDRLRQLPQDLAGALAADGFYRTLVPPELGGMGLAPPVVANISEILAMGNASAAWCTFIGSTSQIMFAALESAQLAEVLANPDVITAGVFAPSGTATAAAGPDGADGYIVKGRWAWASGSHNAEWISGGVQIDTSQSTDSAQPALGRVFFRPEDIVLHDDWYTNGLRGSGSSTFEADGIWLPANRIAYERTILKSPYAAQPLYRMPLFGLLALPIGAIALGMARACIDEVIEVATSKVPQGSRRTLGRRPSLHSAVAVADTEVRAARTLLYAEMDAAWERAQHGLADLEIRRNLRTATTHAMQASLRVAQSMNSAVGGTAVFEASPLQRHLRDAQTASAHFMVAMPVMELAGRTFFDADADTSGL
ncbi:acyl-CoA dehydrogenase family protein [Candidatus Poriferisodalis sp.]|uniref:acyl-CoA dehydrogenase family protein n=1 Tax=Candidatus Poriferisodalis sp. TaxID=3101277 RepID=UPI003B527E1D